jgi:hypothetical protein
MGRVLASQGRLPADGLSLAVAPGILGDGQAGSRSGSGTAREGAIKSGPQHAGRTEAVQ